MLELRRKDLFLCVQLFTVHTPAQIIES